MIRLSLGNVGSGKTACEVRNLLYNPTRRPTYSNITTTGIKNNIRITPEMIIKKQLIEEKKKRDGTIVPIYKLRVNEDFWKAVKKPINIVLDEAHTMLNSRMSHSRVNLCMNDFLSLIRRMLGSNDAGEGEAVFITQLPMRLDKTLRDLSTEIRHHIAHYKKTCDKCGFTIIENSDSAGQIWLCPRCGTGMMHKHSLVIEIFFFQNMIKYFMFLEAQQKTYYNRIYIKNISQVFKHYNTMQWDSMFSELY